MKSALSDLNPFEIRDAGFVDHTGVVFETPKPQVEVGIAMWNLDEGFLYRTAGPQWKVGQTYTHCAWIKWRESDDGYRTLFRGTRASGSSDASVMVDHLGTELGVFAHREGEFRGSGYHIEKRSFQGVCVIGKGDSATGNAGVSEFYVGSVDQPMQFVGQADRVVSGAQISHIGWPRQGPGRLARMTMWNYALSADAMDEYWELSRALVVEDGIMDLTVSDLIASQTTEDGITDTGGTRFNAPAPEDVAGVQAWDLNTDASSPGDGFFRRTDGPHWAVAQDYTHCAWIRWRQSSNGWRTIFRGSSDSSIIVQTHDTELGMYSDRNGDFIGSNYHIKLDSWQMVCVVGKGDSPTSTWGKSEFFVGSLTEEPRLVGEADRVVSGTTVWRIGNQGSGPGGLARFTAWNFALTPEHLQEYWSVSRPASKEAGLMLSAVSHMNASAVDTIGLTDKSGARYNTPATRDEIGVQVWSMDSHPSYFERTGGYLWTVAQDYTHCGWIKWRIDDAGGRSLWRGDNDHSIMVRASDTELGLYLNRGGADGGFRGSGYHIEKGSFQLVCSVATGESATSFVGVNKFFVGSEGSAPALVGQVDRVVSGCRAKYMGYPGQGPGKLAMFTAWNYALTLDQLNEYWSVSKAGVTELGIMQSTVTDLYASDNREAGMTDKTGIHWKTPAVEDEHGVAVWPLDNSFVWPTRSVDWVVYRRYTHCAWIKWRLSDQGGRTLFHGGGDHSIYVENEGTELGVFSHRRGDFRGTGYHIKKGTIQLVCSVGEGNQPDAPEGTSDFYVGSVTEKPQHVGKADRVMSGTRIYRIGSPEQGPGKLNRLTAWNYPLSADQITEFWSLTAPHSPEAGLMQSTVSNLDASEGVEGDAGTVDLSGTLFGGAPAIQRWNGVKLWNLDDASFERTGGYEMIVGQAYTHCGWIQWRESNYGSRSLFRNDEDHSVFVVNGGTELGMYSNRDTTDGGGFRGTGYNIIKGTFQCVCVVGEGTSATSKLGSSKFFVGSLDEAPAFVGEADHVVSGTTGKSIGAPGQSPGKLARVTMWNYALSDEQLAEFWGVSKPVLVEVDVMQSALIDLDASGNTAAERFTDQAGTEWQSPAPVDESGVMVWDLETSPLLRVSGSQWTVAQFYTHCQWIKWRESDDALRSLFRGDQDISVVVNKQGKELGMYSERAGGIFSGSGYEIKMGSFELVCAVGEQHANTITQGSLKFYVGSKNSNPGYKGSVNFVVTGTKVSRIGSYGQSPGKLARFTAWNFALSYNQMREFWQQTKDAIV